ncbi:MAG TPA: SUMF1/EgtB/PvdO family nonheme iron enzyme, partial [Spirochaetota bacterium]|nr:SUMF1/EgtB/PvdO family nonheme iron enzyme [Spirochaetota bacterium]
MLTDKKYFWLLVFLLSCLFHCRNYIRRENNLNHCRLNIDFTSRALRNSYGVRISLRIKVIAPGGSRKEIYISPSRKHSYRFLGFYSNRQFTLERIFHYARPGSFNFSVLLSNRQGFFYKTNYIVQAALLTPVCDSELMNRGITNPGPVIHWQRVPYARKYRIQIAAGKDFSGPLFDREVNLRFFRIRSGLQPGRYYRVRIKALRSDTPSFYSKPFKFALLELSMVKFSSGYFTMGKPPAVSGTSAEEPPHQVYLSSFAIDKYEVTLQEYTLFLNTCSSPQLHYNKYMADPDRAGIVYRDGEYHVLSGRRLFPVVFVSYYNAAAFASWRGMRLPTEAEWEYAAKGRTYSDYTFTNMKEQHYPFGLHLSNVFPVTNFAELKSSSGLYNICGNVWEWCADWY